MHFFNDRKNSDQLVFVGVYVLSVLEKSTWSIDARSSFFSNILHWNHNLIKSYRMQKKYSYESKSWTSFLYPYSLYCTSSFQIISTCKSISHKSDITELKMWKLSSPAILCNSGFPSGMTRGKFSNSKFLFWKTLVASLFKFWDFSSFNFHPISPLTNI